MDLATRLSTSECSRPHVAAAIKSRPVTPHLNAQRASGHIANGAGTGPCRPSESIRVSPLLLTIPTPKPVHDSVVSGHHHDMKGLQDCRVRSGAGGQRARAILAEILTHAPITFEPEENNACHAVREALP